MGKRTDLHSILIIGAGPIVIGQACEFDYSGAQACKALREEGYRVILVNSNPATIMTDPELSDRTYIEPLTPEALEKIIERERPDAILPTVGRIASGRSRSMILARMSGVSGSTYVRSASSGSVMIVAGLLLTRMTSRPSARRALHAWDPE